METYPDFNIEEIQGDEGKRTKRYETLVKEKHNVGFSKRRVGETVKRLLSEKKGDEETIKNLQTVVDKIWEILQLQVKAQPVQ